MNVISISHKTAPVEIRELFAFSKDEQKAFINEVLINEAFDECVLVSTCNRTEVYFTGREQTILLMQRLLAEFKNANLEILLKYFLIYCEENAIRHLFRVTCGMDSMVIGEDEILGQMKEAYQTALQLGAAKYQCNTLFQAAIACSKRIKTDTRLSKTPISIGTLAANEILNFPKKEKKILIIGLTGKIGTILMKNMYGRHNIEILGTSRSHNTIEQCHLEYKNVKMIDYKDRYPYMDEADVIVSATTSPHYTIIYHELKNYIHTKKTRLFLDLSVPMDIDKEVTRIHQAKIYDIDYFNETSANNTLLKEQEVMAAQIILEEQLDVVLKELLYHEFLPELPSIKKHLSDQTFEKSLYELKEKANSSEWKVVLNLYRKLI